MQIFVILHLENIETQVREQNILYVSVYERNQHSHNFRSMSVNLKHIATSNCQEF